MLERLSIRNLALIESVQISFQDGFNVLTGETGAGKSIVIGALNAVLGEKMSADSVRTGADRAVVEAVFDISGLSDLSRLLEESGIPCEDSSLVVRREIAADGRGRVFVNDSAVTAGRLREIGTLLVDLHGQHEHQSLLRAETHLSVVDRFGRLEAEAEKYRGLYDEHFRLLRQRDQMRMDEHEKQRMLELLDFAIREITELDPKPGEDAELDADIRRMAHSEKLFAAADETYASLYAEEDSVLARLGRAETALDRVLEFDSSLASVRERIASGRAEIEEASSVLRDYRQDNPYDPADLDRKTGRLEKIDRLKKKYGGDIPAVLAYRERAEDDLRHVQNSEEEARQIEEKLAASAKELAIQASRLSGRRHVVAKLLEDKVHSELAELGMKNARFIVGFSVDEDENGFLFEDEGKKFRLTRQGRDQVEFLISANPGEDPRPLRKVASGGELSRLMLAFKSVLASAAPLQVATMVFDEIDAGISGETALIVGRKMKALAAAKQIVCVTHLPQIAARSDAHFTVKKETRTDGRTVTGIRGLNNEEKENEIARLLKGDKITEAALTSARELIRQG